MLSIKTTSLRKRTADKAINKIVEEHPEYETIARYLCDFQGQRWADSIRKQTKLDTASLMDAIKENGEYFGIKNVGFSSMDFQKATLEFTDEILNFLDTALRKDNFFDVERELIGNLFYGKPTSVNERKLTKATEPMFLKIFERNYLKFDELLEQLKDIKDGLDEETEIVFHDIEILFRLSALFRDFVPRTSDINKRDIYCIMSQAIDQLKYYPFDDDVKTVLQMKFKKENIYAICNKLKKHHDYVEKRYYTGLEALKWIFWGYTALEI